MNRLLFFILMPIIFEFIEILIFHFSNDWVKSIKTDTYIFLVLLGIDYVIEFVYLQLVRKALGIWIFSNEFNDVESFYAYSIFVVLSVLYIITSVIFSFVFRTHFSDQWPISHTVILIGCFVIFCIAQANTMHDGQDDKAFNSLEYCVEENTIYLRALGDGRETSGNIYGFGTGYIQGKIETNYNLYYAFSDENGKTIIRSILYNDNNVNIYEISDECDPRIVCHKYYKSYNCEKGHNKYDEYYIYDIYIPSISNSIKIDME